MPTSNFGVNRIGGPGQQGIHSESSSQKFDIGELLELADGRRFRYAQFAGTAVAAGVMTSTDVSLTCLAETDNAVDGTQTDRSGCSTAIGSTKFFVDNGGFSSVVADQYAGGYLHTTDDTGEGYTYRIKSNTATAATDEVVFTLHDPLVVAIDTTTDIAITGNRWTDLRISDATAAALVDYIPAGVTMRAMTADYYGWVQTRGVATCLADGTITVGSILTLSDGTDGAVQTQDAYTEPIVGTALFAPDSTGHVGVLLNID